MITQPEMRHAKTINTIVATIILLFTAAKTIDVVIVLSNPAAHDAELIKGYVYYTLGAALINLAVTLFLMLKKSIPDFYRALLPALLLAVFELGLAVRFQLMQIYLTLVVASAICFIYLIPKAFLAYSSSVFALTYVITFITKSKMLMYDMPFKNMIYQFVTFNIFNTLLYVSCRIIARSYEWNARQNNIFSTLLKNSSSYIIITDSRGRVLSLSDTLAHLIGADNSSRLVGMPLLDIFISKEIGEIYQEVMEHESYFTEAFPIKLNGETRWFRLHSVSFEPKKSLARIIESYDITDIMEAKTQAEVMSNAKSDFLANMSHEIRTPMNAIIGMADLMMMSEMNESQLEQVGTIKRSASHLLRIINDILDLTKIRAERLNIINIEFDVASMLNDTINMINMKLLRSDIAFTCFVSNEVPPALIGDEIRIKQILTNILNNAVKFTQSGNISLEIFAQRPDDETVKLDFYIKDTGQGIKKQDLSKLFDEFAQVDTVKNRNISGTGLGLAICQNLVELMDGTIGVDSEYGEGTTFNFSIKLKARTNERFTNLTIANSLAVVCFEPNKYEAEALGKILTELGVRHEVFTTLPQYENALTTGTFTHSFYAEAAEAIAERNADKCEFIMVKAYDDVNHIPKSNAIYRPVMITTVAKALADDYTKNKTDYAADFAGDYHISGALVLVVDDNPENLLVSKGLISKLGAEVATAQNGFEAIELCEKNRYDLIFMDHMMPVIDGIETAKRIQSAQNANSQTPIIALSANAVEGARDLFLSAGMSDFISKPIHLGQLKSVLINYLPENKIIKD